MATRITGPELLTPAQAARILRRTTKTLIRLAEAGELHPVKTPAGTRRYHRAEVEALRNARENEGRP